MKGRFRSVRGRTILYFSAILSLAVILVGGISYAWFSQKYRAALERENSLRLAALSEQIDQQVFRYVRRQIIELLQNNTLYQHTNAFFRNPGEERSVKIANAVQELKSLTAFSHGVIGAVDLYSPELGISLSSYTGFMDLGREPLRADLELWEEAVARGNAGPWDLRRISSYQGTTLICFGLIPANAARSDARGLAAFSVNPLVFASYLSVMEGPETACFLFYEDLSPLYGDLETLERSLAPGELGRISAAGTGGQVYRAVSASREKLVFYIRSTETPVILALAVSAGSFQGELWEFFRLVLLAGSAVFLAALGATGLISQRLYSPLKRLVASARAAADAKAGGGGGGGGGGGWCIQPAGRIFLS